MDTFRKYDKTFDDQISSLIFQKKQLFCLAYIERQKDLVGKFDSQYDENISDQFNDVLNRGYKWTIEGSADFEVNQLINLIESITPDTEDYGEVEGTFGQNACISVLYFLRFCISKNEDEFSLVMEKVLESLDVIKYEKDENYQEATLILPEIDISKELMSLLGSQSVNNQLINEVREWSRLNSITA